MTDFEKKVYETLNIIPRGKVVTYADIADFLGNRHLARAVGNALHVNPRTDLYPCYKVVNSKGGLAVNFGDGIDTQKQRLENDGIAVVNYSVDLELYRWKFPIPEED